MSKRSRWMMKILIPLIAAGTLTYLTPLLAESYTSSSEVNRVDMTRSELLLLTQEHQAVLKVYNRLMLVVLQADQKEHSLSDEAVDQICAAILFAAKHHHSQTRNNLEKTPYICHPLEVAYDLMQLGGVRDVPVILGAILHDVTDHQAIKKEFGAEVAKLVKEVSTYPVSARESHQRDLMIHATDQSVNSIQIELADLLYSLKELSTTPPSHWKKERIDHYFEWAQSVVDRFPEANPPLREAIETTIQTYWDHQ